jgi:hypothetical protein
MRLAISQIVLGVLVVVFSLIVTVQAFPTQFSLPAEESGVQVIMEVYPTTSFAQVSAFLAFFLGLAVVGCGIAQLLKARRPKRAKAR